MKKEIAKPIIYSLYGLSILLLVVGLVVLKKDKGATLATIEPNHAYNILQHLELPVVADPVTIGKPYTDNTVKIVQNYYDYKGTSEEQRESLIYYEDTYMQSSGVSYSLGGEQFDAIAVLDGEVVSVKEDPLLGNSVTIKHSSSMQTIYQSIQDIQVKEGDTVCIVEAMKLMNEIESEYAGEVAEVLVKDGDIDIRGDK